jgi:Predicted transmembrane transcriptional regulator (anti-sigma factor)
MCPDRDLVSAYIDGEIPSPWKERLEEHFSSCADCAALVARYRALGMSLRSDGSEAVALAAAQERGRQRLDALLSSAPAARPALHSGTRRGSTLHSWGRSINMPIPFAAAAAVLVLLLGGATVALAIKPAGQGAVQTAAASGEISPTPAQAKAASLDELVRYLDSSDGQITLTINLPTGTTFGSVGKPVIMRQGQVLRAQTVSGESSGGSAP